MALETIWRPKSPRLLTDTQKQEKLKKDSEYEIAHLNLTADYRRGKLTQPEFESVHAKQWNDYENWAKSAGLYEEVTPEQQLDEAEEGLNVQVDRVNLIRVEMKKTLLEVREAK